MPLLAVAWIWQGDSATARAQEGLDKILAAAQEAVAADDYPRATELYNRATGVAKRAQDPELQADVVEAKKRVGILAREFKKLDKARDTLRSSPGDGPANSAVGEFYGCLKEDWETGLPYLARSDSEPVRLAARFDLKTPQSHKDRLTLGELWMAAANESRDAKLKDPMHLRARMWLLEALKQSSGDAERTAAQNRLNGVELFPTKVVIWNTHNGVAIDRGTLDCNVQLMQGSNVVFERPLTLPWFREATSPTVLRPPRLQFDRVRVEVLTYYRLGGGLAEVEVFQGRMPLARDAYATASAVFDGNFTADRATDGNLGDKLNQSGLWLLPDSEPGWIEVQLNRR